MLPLEAGSFIILNRDRMFEVFQTPFTGNMTLKKSQHRALAKPANLHHPWKKAAQTTPEQQLTYKLESNGRISVYSAEKLD